MECAVDIAIDLYASLHDAVLVTQTADTVVSKHSVKMISINQSINSHFLSLGLVRGVNRQ